MPTFSKSKLAFKEAQAIIPGGVNSPARAFGAVGGIPIFFERGEGPFLFDVDGNRFIDYVGSWGPLLFGHAFSPVVEAIQHAAAQGTTFGAPTTNETKLASLVSDAMPSVEKVRFVNSGTEATMSAIRLARGATGRDRIIKFSGNYHGHSDSLLVAAGSSAATLGVPSSPGVTQGVAQDTIVLPYNNAAALEQVYREQGKEIAAVIFEPVAGNMGVVLPHATFLDALQTLPKQFGSLFICDEVMTGFRVAHGGAQSLFGLKPDITTLGKIIGGGLPVGAYGGTAEVMDHILPQGKVFQAGTLSGNPLATAAGIAMLEMLRDQPPYETLEALSKQLCEGLSQAATEAGVPYTIARVGSMATFFFGEHTVTDWQTASECNTALYAKWFWAMAKRGVYLPCSQYEAFFVSAAHTELELTETIAAAKESLQEIA